MENLRTGRKVPFSRERGVYALSTWTQMPEKTVLEQGFPRLGR